MPPDCLFAIAQNINMDFLSIIDSFHPPVGLKNSDEGKKVQVEYGTEIQSLSGDRDKFRPEDFEEITIYNEVDEWSWNVYVGKASNAILISLLLHDNPCYPRTHRLYSKLQSHWSNHDCVYLELTNGKVVGCDFVVSATGVQPNGDSISIVNEGETDRSFHISHDGKRDSDYISNILLVYIGEKILTVSSCDGIVIHPRS